MTVAQAEAETAASASRWAVTRRERGVGFTTVMLCVRSIRLLVGEGGSRTLRRSAGSLGTWQGRQQVPAEPGLGLPTVMAVGDRLLLCTSSVFDRSHGGPVPILKRSGSDLPSLSPLEFLEKLLEDRHGAAAVLRTDDLSGADRKRHRGSSKRSAPKPSTPPLNLTRRGTGRCARRRAGIRPPGRPARPHPPPRSRTGVRRDRGASGTRTATTGGSKSQPMALPLDRRVDRLTTCSDT